MQHDWKCNEHTLWTLPMDPVCWNTLHILPLGTIIHKHGNISCTMLMTHSYASAKPDYRCQLNKI